jgi:hypothetical protein
MAHAQQMRLMSGVSQRWLAHPADAERRALFDHLKSLPQP